MVPKKTWFVVILLVCFVLAAGTVGCRNSLSDEDLDKLADRISEDPPKLHEDMADQMVDALMAHPRYLEFLEDDRRVELFTNALLERPLYQTTPEEDCATVLLMAAVMSGEYEVPPDSDTERLCAWYLDQVEEEGP